MQHPSDATTAEREVGSKHLQGLIFTGEGDFAGVVEQAKIVSEAVNEARDLQNRPANDLTPTALARHARRSASRSSTSRSRWRVARGHRWRARWARSPLSRRGPSRSRR